MACHILSGCQRYYHVEMAVWDAPPEEGCATRLAYSTQDEAFLLLQHFEHFDLFDSSLWKKSSHSFERSHFDQSNVTVSGGSARIRILQGTLSAGEFSTGSEFSHGTYSSIPVLTITNTVLIITHNEFCSI